MMEPSGNVFEQALKLPLDERARLAAELLASMDGEPDADRDALWAVEIERRAKLPETNDVDWEVVRAELDAKYRPR
jgi:hypothetical protein